MIKPPVSPAEVIKFKGNESSFHHDLLAVEEPLEIRLGFGPINSRGQKIISVTMRTPGHDFELALGFLFTEGIIKSKDAILQIKYCTDAQTSENHYNIVRVELHEKVSVDLEKLQRNFYTTSSCGVCGKASIDAIHTLCDTHQNNDIVIKNTLLYRLPELLRKHQNVFEHTGGLHACAIFNEKGILKICREDVGRHNALDKLIGAAMGSNQIPLSNYILLLSGRASFELIQKAAMAGIPIVAAAGAPSSLALQLAKELNITLIGFLKADRFNIYTGKQRIELEM